MAPAVEIDVVVPANVIAGLVINEDRAGAQVIWGCGNDSIANDLRAPVVKLARVVERDDLGCTVLQVVIRKSCPSFMNWNVNPL